MRDTQGKIAIVDLETTGLGVDKGDKVIQIGAVIIENHRIVDTYSVLINPNQEIPLSIQHLTGITQEQVAKAPSFAAVAQEWFDRLKDGLFVAHNLKFDYECLRLAFAEVGLTFAPPAMDTLVLGKILFPMAPGFNLLELSNYCGYSLVNSHDALEDARATVHVWQALVEKAMCLPMDLRRQLHILVGHQDYDTGDFFRAPASLTVDLGLESREGGEAVLPKSQDTTGGSYSWETLAAYTWQKMPLHSPVILEMPGQVLPKNLIVTLLCQSVRQGQPMALSAASATHRKAYGKLLRQHLPQVEIVEVKPYSGFLHRDALDHLLAKADKLDLNHKEWLVLAANLVWAQESATGNYDELNSELHSWELLSKYVAEYLRPQTHTNYQAMLQAIDEADILLMTHRHLWSLPQGLGAKACSLHRFKLLMDDTTTLAQALRHQSQTSLSISAIFIHLRQILETHLWSVREDRLRSALSRLVSMTHDLLDTLEQKIRTHHPDKSTKQVMRWAYLSKGKSEEKDFWQTISYWLHLGITTVEDLSARGLSETFPFLKELASNFQAFNLKGNHQYYYVTANEINQYYFHFTLVSQPISLSHLALPFITQFDQGIFLTRGHYYEEMGMGPYRVLHLRHPAYLPLPLFQPSPLTGRVLLDHCLTRQELTQSFQGLVDFLEERSGELKKKVVILLPTQELCEALYHRLKDLASLHAAYAILAQGVGGSIRKNRRRFMELDEAILIATPKHWQHLAFPPQVQAVSLIYGRLPFLSHQYPLMEAIKEEASWEASQVFAGLIYPKMLEDFRESLTILREFYIFNDVIILDDRVFSRSYSADFRQKTANLIQFESIK